MGKVRSEKTLERLTKKANKEFSYLNECPRCGKGYDEIGDYQFNGFGVEFYQRCKDCGLLVTHCLDWIETEVEILE